MKVKHRSSSLRLHVRADSVAVMSHAGASLVQGTSDAVGLTAGLARALGSLRRRDAGHDPGCVIRDLAVSIADGGRTVSAIEALRGQSELFGGVASDATAWRVLDRLTPELCQSALAELAKARARVWAHPRVELPRLLVIDGDATLVNAHSDKEGAAGNYKHGFGFHPIVWSLDATREPLAVMLRPGNAGANRAADLIGSLELALEQLPDRAFDIERHHVVVRLDSAGASHAVVEDLFERGLGFVIGFDLTDTVWDAIEAVGPRSWKPAVDQDGVERDYAHVAELDVDMSGWGEGLRLVARREIAHAGAQLRMVDAGGWRHQVILTNLADDDIAFIAAVYQGRGRAEQVIDELKQTGLGHLPSARYETNEAWVLTSLIAATLVRWAQLLTLDGRWQKVRIATLRNELLHTGARIVRHARKTTLVLNQAWAATGALIRAFARLRQLPAAQPM